MKPGRPARLLVGSLLLLTLAGFGLSRSQLARQRGFNPDELEHLHFAWLTAQGQVAYRDYFDHHAPLLHLVFASRLERGEFGGEDGAILAIRDARTFSLTCTLLTLVGGAVVMGRAASPGAALSFVGILCGWSTFISKSLEFRPDVPAMLFLVIALGLFVSERPRLAGFAAGLALLFTPKSVFAMAGLAASFLFAKAGPERRPIRGLFRFAQGLALPLLATVFWLWRERALSGAWQFAIVAAARWKGPSAWPVWREFLRSDPTITALLALATALTLIRWRTSSPLQRASFLMMTAGFAGLAIVTYPSPQFLLLILPQGASMIALAADQLTRRWPAGGWQPSVSHAALAACVVALGFPAHVRAFARGNTAAIIAMEQIARNTALDEQVLDGFIGYAPLRPHGTFFPFLHRDLRALRERVESPPLLKSLRDGQVFPKFALMTHYLRDGVEPAVWKFLEANYAPLDQDSEVRVRLFDNDLGYWDDTAARSLGPAIRREPHALLLDGWSGPRTVDGVSGRWLSGTEPSVILLPVREPAAFDLLIDSATTNPMTIRVEVNGARLAAKERPAGRRRDLFEVPAGLWTRGLNRIVLSNAPPGRRNCFVSSVQLARRKPESAALAVR